MNNQTSEWPSNYYKTVDPLERKTLLEKQLEENNDKESNEYKQNELRMELWKARYQTRGKDVAGIDYFIRAWMNLSFLGQARSAKFGEKKRQREMEEIAKEFCCDFPQKYGEMGRDILFKELYQLMIYIIDIDSRDKSYNNLLLGLGRMSNDSLIEKIANDFILHTRTLPDRYGMKAEFSLMAQAATEAFCEVFPENQKLIL